MKNEYGKGYYLESQRKLPLENTIKYLPFGSIRRSRVHTSSLTVPCIYSTWNSWSYRSASHVPICICVLRYRDAANGISLKALQSCCQECSLSQENKVRWGMLFFFFIKRKNYHKCRIKEYAKHVQITALVRGSCLAAVGKTWLQHDKQVPNTNIYNYQTPTSCTTNECDQIKSPYIISSIFITEFPTFSWKIEKKNRKNVP